MTAKKKAPSAAAAEVVAAVAHLVHILEQQDREDDFFARAYAEERLALALDRLSGRGGR